MSGEEEAEFLVAAMAMGWLVRSGAPEEGSVEMAMAEDSIEGVVEESVETGVLAGRTVAEPNKS